MGSVLCSTPTGSYVMDSVGTGIAKAGKNSWFANLRADDMSALAMRETIQRAGLSDKKDEIDDIIREGGIALMATKSLMFAFLYYIVRRSFPDSIYKDDHKS